MSTDKALSWVHCEESSPEDAVTVAARDRAEQLGCEPVTPATGATLAALAASARARAVVEVGTGTGVSSLHLLRGMPDDGVLTTIDIEVEHQLAAKEAFSEARVRPTRVRSIRGHAIDVLPRLTDAAYDMIVIDIDPDGIMTYVEHALRLLRPGGTLVVNHALWHDQVADPARRDVDTVTMRTLEQVLRSDEQLVVSMLPVGDGLLLAVRR
jgi:predicted O-methyltransferase YrrM